MEFITDESTDYALNTNRNLVATIPDLNTPADDFNNPLSFTASFLFVITILSIILVSKLRSKNFSLSLTTKLI